MAKLEKQITVHFTKNVYDKLVSESKKREGDVGSRVSITARQLAEERLEQIEHENTR